LNWSHDHVKGETACAQGGGSAADITRRRASAEAGIEVFGDATIWDGWLSTHRSTRCFERCGRRQYGGDGRRQGTDNANAIPPTADLAISMATLSLVSTSPRSVWPR